MTRSPVGLIVNPIAGMGGRVALKGTDGGEVLRDAVARGAEPVAPARALQALELLGPLAPELEVLAFSEEMGAPEARAAGLRCTVLAAGERGPINAAQTRAAAREMASRGAALLLFAGGDGTARDVLDAVGAEQPVLGIPAGVKMHSAVFATSPRSAGRIARELLESGRDEFRLAEVMDVDEELLREGVVASRLHGEMRVPAAAAGLQSAKLRAERPDRAALAEIAAAVGAALDPEALTIFGPGTTTAAILRECGVEPTLLGFDAVRGGRAVARDADERELLRLLDETPEARLVLAPVGGQGFVLGRGNQQVSPAVLRVLGAESLLIVATESKLASLAGRPLLVDCGDPDLDRRLAGFRHVVVGERRSIVYRVEAA